MRTITTLFIFLGILLSGSVAAQKKKSSITGRIVDENNRPLAGVSISILGKSGGTLSGDSGQFLLVIAADKAIAIVFSYQGYKPHQRNFLLSNNEAEVITVQLEKGVKELQEVTVTNERNRLEAGLISINPKQAINVPSPVGGIESLIKVFVGSNNELTSNYNVRGGSYDENLVYVNDVEVYRPYLAKD